MASPATLDRTLDALANDQRRRIVDRLVEGPLDTPALGADFAMSKQALNKHLVQLEDAGLIERRRHGRVHEIRLRAEPLDELTTWVSRVRLGWESSLDRLGRLLEEDR